jgi:hypothetical protein
VTADQFRQDLLNAKIGNGRYGFRYPFPPRLKDARPHTIRVVIAGSNQDLEGSPKTVHTALAVPPRPVGPLAEGWIDTFNEGSIGGWAWDPKEPDRAVYVEVYDGKARLATVIADGDRNDLRKAKMGNGRHGFAYIFPRTLKDGKPHIIRVKFAGSDKEINGSPKEFKTNPGQP